MRLWNEVVLWTRNKSEEPLSLTEKFELVLDGTRGQAEIYDDYYGITYFYCVLKYTDPNGYNFSLDCCFHKRDMEWSWHFSKSPGMSLDAMQILFAMVKQEYCQDGDFMTFLNILEGFELSLVKMMIHPKRDMFMRLWISYFNNRIVTLPDRLFQEKIEELLPH